MTLVVSPPRSHSVAVQAYPRKIIALGDSLIYGYGDPEGGGWVERLRRRWMFSSNPGLVLYNLGVRGDKVQQVEQRLEAEFRCRGELRNRTPDGILLSVGLNDSAQLGRSYGRNMTDLEQFQQQMADLLTQARQLCPVWMIGAPPINEDKMPFAGCLYYSHREQYRYKEVTRQLCQQQQIPYLDIFDQWLSQGTAWWQSRLCDDGIHPNVLGYETLLETITAWQPLMDFALEAA